MRSSADSVVASEKIRASRDTEAGRTRLPMAGEDTGTRRASRLRGCMTIETVWGRVGFPGGVCRLVVGYGWPFGFWV